jgi:hypothetical protein
MLSSTHDFRVVCKINFSGDINLMHGFFEMMTDELASLGSRGSPLASIARISKSTNC